MIAFNYSCNISVFCISFDHFSENFRVNSKYLSNDWKKIVENIQILSEINQYKITRKAAYVYFNNFCAKPLEVKKMVDFSWKSFIWINKLSNFLSVNKILQLPEQTDLRFNKNYHFYMDFNLRILYWFRMVL